MEPPRYLALLGKTTALATAELAVVLRRYSSTIREYNPPYVVEIVGDINPAELIKQLGGTVKIYQTLTRTPADILLEQHQDHFCISSIGHLPESNAIAQDIKTAAIKHGIKPHFRLLRDPFYSAGITSKYTEFCIIPYQGQKIIAQAVAVQQMSHWSQKDYARPAIDTSSGMLPPKVARMMINIAINEPLHSQLRVYDPMCGSGTILLELLDINVQAFGSDQSIKAVSDAKTNTDWFISTFSPQTQATIFQADATHVTLDQIGGMVDAIVFEGYLGPPHPTVDQVPNLIKGLTKLYKGVFKTMIHLLKPRGRLVCALPEYTTPGGVKNLDQLVDWTSTLGYTRLNRFTYGRQHAFVKRAIYVLQKSAR